MLSRSKDAQVPPFQLPFGDPRQRGWIVYVRDVLREKGFVLKEGTRLSVELGPVFLYASEFSSEKTRDGKYAMGDM